MHFTALTEQRTGPHWFHWCWRPHSGWGWLSPSRCGPVSGSYGTTAANREAGSLQVRGSTVTVGGKWLERQSHSATLFLYYYSIMAHIFFLNLSVPGLRTATRCRCPPSCAESTGWGSSGAGGSWTQRRGRGRTAPERPASARRAAASRWVCSAAKWTAAGTKQPLQTHRGETNDSSGLKGTYCGVVEWSISSLWSGVTTEQRKTSLLCANSWQFLHSCFEKSWIRNSIECEFVGYTLGYLVINLGIDLSF